MAKKIKSMELGFGHQAAENGQRLMNADGTANTHRFGGPKLSSSDIFHKLTTMNTARFLMYVAIVYTLANVIFASIYYALGVKNLGIPPSGSVWRDLLEAFFFSTQCFTTIGFGRINPHGIATNLIASLEGLLGLLSFALATGLIYGRFSRPRAHLIHSKNLLVAPYRNTKKALMFRIASTRRHSMLIENSVSVSMGINEMEHGLLKRKFYNLDLELSKVNFMNLSWTLVHEISEESPIWGKTMEDLVKERVELIVLFKAVEETNYQTVIERFSYFVDEIVWGAKFISAIGKTTEGRPFLDLNKIDDFELTELPVLTEQVGIKDAESASLDAKNS